MTKEIKIFEDLKNLLYSQEWPEAILEFQITDENSEEDKLDRAEGIVDILIEEDLINKKFLDFGCGEGHMCKYAAKSTKVSVGYDINRSGKLEWENENEKHFLTNNFDKVIEKGPFDIILIYDVLDHSKDPVDVLDKAKKVLKENGLIYLRTHPWCARHGGHFYRNINKAFINLIFNEEELNRLNLKNNETIKTIYPIKNYGDIIKNSNLKIKNLEIENQEIENFFKNNKIIKNKILQHWGLTEWREECPDFQMKQCFLDYVLFK